MLTLVTQFFRRHCQVSVVACGSEVDILFKGREIFLCDRLVENLSGECIDMEPVESRQVDDRGHNLEYKNL